MINKFIISLSFFTILSSQLLAGEFLVTDQTYEWGTDALEGKRSWDYDGVGPGDWESTEDYYNGQFYMRFEIISQSTSRDCEAQFVIWQDWDWDNRYWLEQASPLTTLNGPGDVAYHNSSPASWWEYIYGPVDFSRPDDFYKFGVMIWSADPERRIAKYLADDNPGTEFEEVWNDRYDWFPLKVRFIVVAVSEGSSFSGWQPYIDGTPPDPCKGMANSSPTPSSNAIEAEDMDLSGYYTENLSGQSGIAVASLYNGSTGAQSDNGSISKEFPHDDGIYDIDIVYINEDDGSSLFDLQVEGSSIDTWNGTELVCKDVYARKTISDVSLYNGDLISIYGEKEGDAYAKIDFIDFIYQGPIIIDPPVFTIDYSNERTQESVTTDYEYSYDESSWITGTNTPLTLAPGEDVFFRHAGISEFVQHLVVPARQVTPDFTVNFSAETTTEEIPSAFQYSLSSDMAGAIQGSGASLALTPGQSVYFRKIATTSAFTSGIQALAVPERPSAPAFTIDYSNETITTEVSSEYHYSTSAAMSSSVLGSGIKVELVPKQDLYLQQLATALNFISDIQHLVVSDRPAIGSYSVDFENVATQEIIPTGIYSSTAEAMPAAMEGNGNVLGLTPGVDMYFQVLPTDSKFGSNIAFLTVPDLPQFSSEDVVDNKTSSTPININLTFDESSTGFELEDLALTNAIASGLKNEYTFNLELFTEGEVAVYLPANSIDDGNFQSEIFAFTYEKTLSNTTINNIGSIQLFPNPSSGIINYDSQNFNLIKIQVIDTKGALVYDRIVTNSQGTINLQSLNKGLYLVKIISANGNLITREIILAD